MKYIFRCMLAVAFFSFALKVKAISNIKVGDYSLVPYFSDYITKYNVFVSKEVENINVNAVLTEDDDYVTGTGNIVLSDGINEVILKVIKKNEDILTYQINIYRNYEENNNIESSSLSKLIINGYDISFLPDKYEYDLNILDDTRLDIEYEKVNEDATVRITGNSNLKEGKNEVRIIVNSKDKTNTSIYILNVNKVVSVFKEEESINSEISQNILGKEHLTKKETNIITISIISICSILVFFIFYMLFIFNRK